MSTEILQRLATGLTRGELVPYLGPGALADVVDPASGEPIPAASESMILAMNNGRPMSARLMWEFSRAAMSIELKRGRSAVNRFLTGTYGDRTWTRAALHDWLARTRPPYVVDINRDTQLQDSYLTTPHTLIRGIARIGGTPYRFVIHHWDGETYREVAQENVDRTLPILFKPLGSPVPTPTFIASDADFVDYITELMGGLAIPGFLKEYRVGRQYVLLGLRLTRDTERMILSDLIHAAGSPPGWALIVDPTAKERRFCERQGLEIVEADIPDLIAAAPRDHIEDPTPAMQEIGC
ncbi:hypothetical protein Thimo_0629 [Thioflavicoccus mobilis 8321]|uniref:SIR2-like domain-containing protein n=1 Tax=Thioflavicoccus mobilis 8321 TaxID=765912 RepID=L0GVU8_9GAMM|nr:SIR2 family protein [Thioflavicoccus mobilis]AGA89470.1 hypothetical protein Thimo_0629 [Thioflavicoccus mobilis 8321]